jgi:hypothetical protein
MRNATLSSTKPLKLHSARGGGDGGMVESSSINNDDDTISLAPLRNPPSNLALFKFYFPCLALWISGPLLSLVDTSFIGLSSSTAAAAAAAGGLSSASQLAALGPATTFIDGSLYLFAFLNVATTNLYASALATASAAAASSSSTVATRRRIIRLGNEELPGESVVRTAAKTSLYAGILLMLLLLAVAQPLIALYIGPEACSASLGLLEYPSWTAYQLQYQLNVNYPQKLMPVVVLVGYSIFYAPPLMPIVERLHVVHHVLLFD